MFNIDEILKSYRERKANSNKKFDTVIEHTRMENMIYKDKRKSLDDMYKEFDYTIEDLQGKGKEKLSSFPHLAQDIFNMLYKISPSERDSEKLSESAKNFNRKITEKIRENPSFSSLKLITEGEDFESIEGTRTFLKDVYDNLDNLLKDISGDKGVLDEIEKSNEVLEKKIEELMTLEEMLEKSKGNGNLLKENDPLVKKSKALRKQIEGISKKKAKFQDIAEMNSHKNKEKIENQIDKAIEKTLNKVNEVKDMIDSFGTEDGRPTTMEGKKSLVEKVSKDKNFRDMAKMIGRMRRMAKQQLNKSFVSGRGERVGVEFGNKLNKVLPSEFSLLANKETEVLFYKKYVNKELKQYKEREVKHEGRGHVIYIVDQSSSTEGARQQWAIALGIALMDLAVKDYRNFAFIPFDTKVGNVHHINHNNYSEEEVIKIAQTFLGGGTNFTEPIQMATNLIDDDRYDGADLVFVTDGHAKIDADIMRRFKEGKKKRNTKCIGILLDKGGSGYVSDATINKFCDRIYRTSELTSDNVAKNVMGGVI